MKMAQKEYKVKHYKVPIDVHWSLAKEWFNSSDKWYQHRAEKILDNEKAKLLWDHKFFTDHNI